MTAAGPCDETALAPRDRRSPALAPLLDAHGPRGRTTNAAVPRSASPRVPRADGKLPDCSWVRRDARGGSSGKLESASVRIAQRGWVAERSSVTLICV